MPPTRELPIVLRARRWPNAPALVADGASATYGDLLRASASVAGVLLAGQADLGEAPIAFLVPPSFGYAAVQWGIWRAGGIAVPLALSHPPAEWRHVLADTAAPTIVIHQAFADQALPLANELGLRAVTVQEALTASDAVALPDVVADRRALIIYTSGTTGRPKGAVTTHANIEAQVTSLIRAWDWSASDRILLVLPLHHVHGIINVLTCALWSGAVCEAQARFDPDAAWDRLGSGELTLFMAVPTIYRKLIEAWTAAPETRRRRWSAGAARLRLMVSGSAALPVEVLARWREVTGHTLLERYGMTEIGMALSNPLEGERRAGRVGAPLPGVRVRLVDEAGRAVPEGTPGEIEVAGPAVFQEYWQNAEATAAVFRDGWFRTGDVAVVEAGSHRILGRQSVDIIKTGGYKVSALEIEEALRGHQAVRECAVVGIADAEWGERVAVAIECVPGMTIDLPALQAWAKERLAPYKVPRALELVDALPRNAMGKVTKPAVARLFTRPPG